MMQNVENKGHIDNQLVIKENNGNLYVNSKTRFSKRFEKLNNEIKNNTQYEGIFDDFEYYNTKLDGIDMPSKLEDGGFSDRQIQYATMKKEKYAKKAEKYKFFESAQWIDSQLFAKIKLEFDIHIEPLVKQGIEKRDIMQAVSEKIVRPVLELINTEGEDDEFLNYDAEDVLGMIYFLTGKCHINWKDYDNI